MLHDRFGIDHITLQLEESGEADIPGEGQQQIGANWQATGHSRQGD
jgi:hypothetical protein